MYGKLFGSIFDGTLHGRFEATVTMMALIALADRDGVVDMTSQAIISRAGWPAEVITRGLEELAKPDPHSRSDAAEGRRIILLDDRRQWGWRLVNYAQYRAMRTADERREYQREYWHRRKHHSTPLNTLNRLNQSQPIADAYAEAEANASSPDTSPRNSAGQVDADAPTAPKKRKTGKPATRIPDDFTLTDERRAVAERERLEAQRVFDRFCDHWRAAAGQNARKHDWDATWRNWCRRETSLAKPAARERGGLTESARRWGEGDNAGN